MIEISTPGGSEWVDLPVDPEATLADVTHHFTKNVKDNSIIEFTIDGVIYDKNIMLSHLGNIDNIKVLVYMICDECENSDYSEVCTRGHFDCIRIVVNNNSDIRERILDNLMTRITISNNYDLYIKYRNYYGYPSTPKYCTYFYHLHQDINMPLIKQLTEDNYIWSGYHHERCSPDVLLFYYQSFPDVCGPRQLLGAVKSEFSEFIAEVSKSSDCSRYANPVLSCAIRTGCLDTYKVCVEWVDKYFKGVKKPSKIGNSLFDQIAKNNYDIYNFMVEAGKDDYWVNDCKIKAVSNNRPDIVYFLSKYVKYSRHNDPFMSSISFNGVTVPVSIDVDTTMEDIRKVASQTFDPSVPEHRHLLPFVGTSVVCVGGTIHGLFNRCNCVHFGFFTVECLSAPGNLFREEVHLVHSMPESSAISVELGENKSLRACIQYGCSINIMYTVDVMDIINTVNFTYPERECAIYSDRLYDHPAMPKVENVPDESANIEEHKLDKEDFRSNLSRYLLHFTDAIIDLVSSGVGVISGSFMAEYVSGLDFSDTIGVGDIDIFISNSNEFAAFLMSNYEIFHMPEAELGFSRFKKSGSANDIYSIKISLPDITTINFIVDEEYNRYDHTVSSLVENFDCTCCMAFTNGNLLSYHKHVKQRMNMNIAATYYSYTRNATYRRSNKYHTRGFSTVQN